MRVGFEAAYAERILAPLVENACRHATREVRLTIEREGALVTIDVVDDGPGVAHGDREAIFEPGHRAAPTAVVAQGAGLGLALARRLARSAGGEVTAEDSAHGARFTVRLPAA